MDNSKKNLKMARKEVRKYLERSQPRLLEMVTNTISTMPKPKYIPRFIWLYIVDKIILEFTSDKLN